MPETSARKAIRFHYLEPARFPVRVLKETIVRILKRHGKTPSELNYVFCEDGYLLEMNRAYLGHDFYTDILTFDLSDSPRMLRADIFISTERVRENASELGIPIYKELMRVVIHGALHLVGFRDKSKAEQVRMRQEEDRYLQSALKSVPRETKEKKRFHVEHGKRVS